MFSRRAFLGALAGLPFVGRFMPKQNTEFTHAAWFPFNTPAEPVAMWFDESGNGHHWEMADPPTPRYFVRDEDAGDFLGQYRETSREEYIRLTGDTQA